MDHLSRSREQVYSAIRAFTCATVAEAEDATRAIIRIVDQEKSMPTFQSTRQATTDEMAAEMDRRGGVIEALEAERNRYLEALEDIDAVGVDFGHFESAARTMQERARKALSAA